MINQNGVGISKGFFFPLNLIFDIVSLPGSCRFHFQDAIRTVFTPKYHSFFKFYASQKCEEIKWHKRVHFQNSPRAITIIFQVHYTIFGSNFHEILYSLSILASITFYHNPKDKVTLKRLILIRCKMQGSSSLSQAILKKRERKRTYVLSLQIQSL